MTITAYPNLMERDALLHAFPALNEVIHLNTGTYGLMPRPALERFLEMMAEFEQFGVACRINLGDLVQEARAHVALLLGCAPEQVTLTGNATDGTNLVLSGLAWEPGDEVITTTEEHEAVIHPLLHLQRCRGVRMRRVEPSSDVDSMQERLEQVRTPRTRLLIFSHVSCETGTRLPAAELCAWAKGHGVQTLVDAAQSLGVVPIDVAGLGCDYLTSNGHKWLGGPKGTGIFYAHPQSLEALCPAHVGAGSLERVDAESGLAELWPTGRRFEFGTRAHALYAGLGASLDWMETLGWARISEHIGDLARYLKGCIAERSQLALLTPSAWEASAGLTSLVVREHLAAEVSAALRQRWRIHVRVVPHYNAIRVSTALFNTAADVDTLMEALEEVTGQHGGRQIGGR